jgi:hypothetical protein
MKSTAPVDCGEDGKRVRTVSKEDITNYFGTHISRYWLEVERRARRERNGWLIGNYR